MQDYLNCPTPVFDIHKSTYYYNPSQCNDKEYLERAIAFHNKVFQIFLVSIRERYQKYAMSVIDAFVCMGNRRRQKRDLFTRKCRRFLAKKKQERRTASNTLQFKTDLVDETTMRKWRKILVMQRQKKIQQQLAVTCQWQYICARQQEIRVKTIMQWRTWMAMKTQQKLTMVIDKWTLLCKNKVTLRTRVVAKWRSHTRTQVEHKQNIISTTINKWQDICKENQRVRNDFTRICRVFLKNKRRQRAKYNKKQKKRQRQIVADVVTYWQSLRSTRMRMIIQKWRASAKLHKLIGFTQLEICTVTCSIKLLEDCISFVVHKIPSDNNRTTLQRITKDYLQKNSRGDYQTSSESTNGSLQVV